MRRSRGRIVAVVAAAAVLVVAVVAVAVLVFGGTPPSDGGAVPPSDDGTPGAVPPSDDSAIETAEQYVAAVAEDPEAMLAEGAAAPTPEQVETLSNLDRPDTEWLVLGIFRPEGGYGRSPAQRLLVGVGPTGEYGSLVVHTKTDYQEGTVSLDVLDRDLEPEIARSGEFPIFGHLNVAMSESTRGELALVSLTDGPVRLTATEPGGAWAYIGTEPLQDEQYRYLRAAYRSHDDTWWVAASWFSPSDPVTDDD